MLFSSPCVSFGCGRSFLNVARQILSVHDKANCTPQMLRVLSLSSGASLMGSL